MQGFGEQHTAILSSEEGGRKRGGGEERGGEEGRRGEGRKREAIQYYFIIKRHDTYLLLIVFQQCQYQPRHSTSSSVDLYLNTRLW